MACRDRRIRFGYACDIHEKPLKKAAFTLSACGVTDKVKLLRCDGLSGLHQGEADDIVIAGMAGADLEHHRHRRLDARSKLHFLLQPMTKPERLRQSLYRGDLKSAGNMPSFRRFSYTVMEICYTGVPREIDIVFAYTERCSIKTTKRQNLTSTRPPALSGKKWTDFQKQRKTAKNWCNIVCCLNDWKELWAMTVQDVYNRIHRAADFSLAMEFDNPGLLVGDPAAQVSFALAALDVTDAVLEGGGARREPDYYAPTVIFHPMKKVTADTLVWKLIRENISVISAHTNLDLAKGGVNDLLAQKLALDNLELLENGEGLGRVGLCRAA
jgi:hypothetical protein